MSSISNVSLKKKIALNQLDHKMHGMKSSGMNPQRGKKNTLSLGSLDGSSNKAD